MLLWSIYIIVPESSCYTIPPAISIYLLISIIDCLHPDFSEVNTMKSPFKHHVWWWTHRFSCFFFVMLIPLSMNPIILFFSFFHICQHLLGSPAHHGPSMSTLTLPCLPGASASTCYRPYGVAEPSPVPGCRLRSRRGARIVLGEQRF